MAAAVSPRKRLSTEGGFTLSEVLVATVLSAILMTAILSAFLFFCKTGLAMGNYSEMEADSRILLQTFARDVREAENAEWETAEKLRLTLEAGTVTYAYDADRGTFTRTTPDGEERELASSIASLRFEAFDVDGDPLSLSNPASAGPDTKMIQLSLKLNREVATEPDSSADVISSRYMLRNKLNL